MREPCTTAIFDTSLFFGGFQRDAVNLAHGFSALGHQTELVLASRPPSGWVDDLPESVVIKEMGIRRAGAALIPLIRILRQGRPHVLISTSTESNLVAMAAASCARVGTRVVARETALWSIQGDPRLRGKVVRLLCSWWYRWQRNVVAISAGVKEDLCGSAGLPSSAVRVIHNPAVTPSLLARCHDPVDHPWFQGDGPPVVLSAGRLHWHKDFPTLLRAFAVVRRKRPARLVILGEGEERPRLEALAREVGINEDFDLPGFVSNPGSFMSKTAVFVCSSPAESFGNALAEAMACGTQLVSTDCPGGPREILDHGRYGRLVPLSDPESMGEAIVQAMDRPVPAEVLRTAAERFHCERIAAEYLTLPAFPE